MENIKVIENTQANGLEVYFNTKPNNNIITELKNKHFRWHTVKKCWYTKKTAEALAFASSLANIDASIKPITATEEKAGKFLQALQPLTDEEAKAYACREWAKAEMQNFILQQNNYYKTNDGLIIEIQKASKLSINKTMYYDDEYEAPQINFDNFADYNRHNCDKYTRYSELAEHEANKFYFAKNGNAGNYIVVVSNAWDYAEDNARYNFTRELTEQEKTDILALYKQQKDEYTARLQRYWNKYQKHISTYGYWADR